MASQIEAVVCLVFAISSASVIPDPWNPWPPKWPAWPDPWHQPHHPVPVPVPVPVATSYANVWKVDHHAVPVIVKPHPVPVAPVIKVAPALGWAGWGHPPPPPDPWALPYGH